MFVNIFQMGTGHWITDVGEMRKTRNAAFSPLSMIHASFKNRSEKIYLSVISQVEKSTGMGNLGTGHNRLILVTTWIGKRTDERKILMNSFV